MIFTGMNEFTKVDEFTGVCEPQHEEKNTPVGVVSLSGEKVRPSAIDQTIIAIICWEKAGIS